MLLASTPGAFAGGPKKRPTRKTANIETAKNELQTVIKFLSPRGYTVRMGLHELGISKNNLDKFRKGRVHIHLKQPASEIDDEGINIDVSISLEISAFRFTGQWKDDKFYPFSDAQIAENYRKLFGSFLDQEAKDELDILDPH